MTGRISIDPASLTVGAGRAKAVGRELAASGHRVNSLPIPEGTPPGVAGQLHAAGASLERASQSLIAQAQFLTFRAQLARLADSPLAMLLGLLSPPLRSPFELPTLKLTPLKAPDNPWGPDWAWKAGHTLIEVDKGELYAMKSLAEGLARTAAAVNVATNPGRYFLDKALKDVPGLGTNYKWNKELADGLLWGSKHKKEFAEAMGKDAIAYNDHAEGRHAFAIGRNLIDFGSWALPVTKFAAAGRAAKLTEEASRVAKIEAMAAKAENLSAQNSRNPIKGYVDKLKRREGEAPKAFEERKKLAKDKLDAAEGRWAAGKKARDEANKVLAEAQAKAEAARHKLDHIKSDLGHEYRHEARNNAIEKPNTAGQSIIKEHAEEQEQEREEQEREREREHGRGRPHAER